MNHLGDYDVIVIGAGHAGIEAAHAAAVLGAKTAVFTMSLDAILAHFPPVSGELTDEEQWNAALAMTSALPQRLFTADYERMVEEEETPSVKA